MLPYISKLEIILLSIFQVPFEYKYFFYTSKKYHVVPNGAQKGVNSLRLLKIENF